MKITRNGTTILDTEDNKHRWRLRDVKQGEVFRFLKGKEDNLYIMGENRAYFYLGTNTAYPGERESRETGNSYVVKFPSATLELGEEQDKRPAEAEKIPLVRIAPPEEE